MANVILTGALVLVTAFYAWATYRILKANERVVEVMHEQAAAIARPYVTITPFLELDNPIFCGYQTLVTRKRFKTLHE